LQYFIKESQSCQPTETDSFETFQLAAATKTFLKKRIVKHHWQRRYRWWGDTAILLVAGGRRRTERIEVSALDVGGDIMLCMTQLNLSARAYHRTRSVKLARTISDLAGCEEIQSMQ